MKDKAFVGASAIAAIAASLCCILPITFALLGVGVIGAAAFFATWRPALLAVTVVLLGFGFYFAYRKPRQACEPGAACEQPVISQASRIWLWIAAALVILFATFPYYSEPVANFLLSQR